MKNTRDYFLEEYYFKPSAIVSYSLGGFGSINAAQHLYHIFREVGVPSISSAFPISRVKYLFVENAKLIDQKYAKGFTRFLDEIQWYIEAFKNQRLKGTPY